MPAQYARRLTLDERGKTLESGPLKMRIPLTKWRKVGLWNPRLLPLQKKIRTRWWCIGMVTEAIKRKIVNSCVVLSSTHSVINPNSYILLTFKNDHRVLLAQRKSNNTFSQLHCPLSSCQTFIKSFVFIVFLSPPTIFSSQKESQKSIPEVTILQSWKYTSLKLRRLSNEAYFW